METLTNELPAFLRKRDGRLEMVIHCTWGQDYDLCAQKFWLRYGVQIEGTAPKVARNYGEAVHEALALRYSHMDDSLADVEAAQMTALSEWFDARPQPSDEWRNTGRAQDLVRAYNAQYPAHDWEVLGVEERFEVFVGRVAAERYGPLQEEFVNLYLAGTKDLIVRWHDGIWVVDHKTASDWGKGDSNSHLDEGRMSFQFRGYAWAEREGKSTFPEAQAILHPERVTLPILGTVGNYLISRKPYATERPSNGRPALPRNQFHQECYPFSDTTLEEWREECLGMAGEILQSWARNYWRRKRNACGHWGRCEFYDLCEADPGQREAMMMGTEFQRKEIEREL